jgi:hypothetical protein
MKNFGKYAIGALMLAGSSLGLTLVTTAPADAHVSIGIGIGGPGYYGGNPCYDARYRYYHPGRCDYGPGYGYGDGFWITDSFGHRSWRGHGGFHGGWHGGHGGGHGGFGGGHGGGGGHHHH